MKPVGVIAHRMVLPAALDWEQMKAGKSAVSFLDDQYPVAVGASSPFVFENDDAWPFTYQPRALSLALTALKQLDYDPQRRYGLVLGMPNLFSETEYMEFTLKHRNDVSKMAAVQGFSWHWPLSFLAEKAGVSGPRLRVDSACATGNEALIVAQQWLNAGLVDDVLVVAASAMLNPVGLALFHNLKALSDASDLQASCPFDRKRRGFVMGEGAAAMWLSNDTSLAHKGYLCGYGQSLNAEKFVDLPEDLSAMERACQLALGSCDEVAYVSAHGTGTPANDGKETQLLHRVFGKKAPHIPISSIKSMIGHTLGAASLIEAIVCLEALKDQFAPPTINLTDPDPECDLDYLPHQGRPISGNFALSNAFAFGGQNACVLFALERP